MNLKSSLKIFGLGFFTGALLLTLWKVWSTPSAPTWSERQDKTRRLEFQLKEAAEEIQKFQGRGHCLSDADCKVVGLGNEACGGFSSFIVYSSSDADVGGLDPAIRRFNERSKELSDLSLQSASCGQAVPKAHCVKERCIPDKK